MQDITGYETYILGGGSYIIMTHLDTDIITLNSLRCQLKEHTDAR